MPPSPAALKPPVPPPPPAGTQPGEPGPPPAGEIENAPYLFPGGNETDVPPGKGSVPIINRPFGSPGFISPGTPPAAVAEAADLAGMAPGFNPKGTGKRGCAVVGVIEVNLSPESVS